MSISPFYSDMNLYLKDLLQFLKDFEWIYTTSNTEFIARGTLNLIPPEWIPTVESLTIEELNEIPFDYIKETWPDSIRNFLEVLKKLKPTVVSNPVTSRQPNKCDDPFLKGIKPKKVHEINELSNEISLNCISTENNIFVDLGCGVGHLTNFLHRKFQYKIIGMEADSERVETAQKLQQTKFPESIQSVKFVQHFIESSSDSFIQSLLIKDLNSKGTTNLVLTGLHACADLTVTALNLFLRVPNAKKLLIMPCCYHKMKFKENSLREFENVPLSQRVKSTQYAKDIINRPFLRLAGQQTAVRWRNNTEMEHNEHGHNMFIRGVVQAVISEDEVVVKNKNVNSESNGADIATGLNKYTLLDKQTKKEKSWSNSQKTAFTNLLEQYPNGANLSEFLTCLQASIQSICENLVLLDRLLYVEEEAERLQLNVTISVKKIVMEDISPRCYAIIAEKNK